MVEPDPFREVDEDVRAELMMRRVKKYGPAVASALILVILVVGGVTGWIAYERSVREHETQVLVEALLSDQPPADRAQALLTYAGNARIGPATIARLHAAASLIEAEDVAGAIDIYDAVAETAEADPLLRDTAVLLATINRLRIGETDGVEQALAEADEFGEPYRMVVRELIAHKALSADNRTAALERLRALAGDAETPEGTAARVRLLIEALAGDANREAQATSPVAEADGTNAGADDETRDEGNE